MMNVIYDYLVILTRQIGAICFLAVNFVYSDGFHSFGFRAHIFPSNRNNIPLVTDRLAKM